MVASGKAALQHEKLALIQQAIEGGKGYKQIASELRVSFRDISRVAKDMLSPAPFDVLDMVVEEMTPQDIADETGADFAEVKRLYEQCVEMLEYMARHETALEKLRGTALLARMRAIVKEKTGAAEHQQSREPLAELPCAARYVCARCGEPLEGAPKIERCPKCGYTKYKEA